MKKAVVFLSFMSSVAYAQSYDFVGSMSPYSWNNTTQYLDTSKLIAVPSADSEPEESHVENVSLTFTPSKSRRRANLQAIVERARSQDPAGAVQLEQTFASADIIGQIDAALQTVGLRADNTADAYAMWWISSWKATKGDVSTASAAAYQAVSAQAARGMVGSPLFASTNDAQKQEMAETLMVQAALIDSLVESHADDQAMLAKVSASILQGAKASGVDLDKMTLTEDGFVPAKPRKRSDAADVVAGEEKALAANAVGQDAGADRDAGLTATQLAMIAAAGGAGLGAVFLLGKVEGKKG
jgi:hypothetical protein